MTAEDDDAFWLREADPAVDICDKSLTVDDCLDVILPELSAHADLPQATILDLGCGVGRLTNPVQARYPQARVIGVDINGNFIADAMLGRPLPGRPLYVCADIEEISGIGYGQAGPPAYHAAFSMAVFQHLDSGRKHACLDEVAKTLRPGGVLCFQYVEGTHSSRCMYDALIGDVQEWCAEAGLMVQRVQHDLLMPRWTWVTATKEAAA